MKQRIFALFLAVVMMVPVYAAAQETEEELPPPVPASELFVLSEDAQTLQAEIDAAQAKMNHAHTMAQAARALGLAEESETIQIAKQHWAQGQASMQELLAAQAAFAPMMQLSFDVFKKTNLSAETFDALLADTGLAGYGQAFYDMEQTYGVNALFAMAVAKTESGLGVTNYAKNRNNYFGLVGRTFESGTEGILAFGELMNRNLYAGKSMQGIAEKFCPLNAETWVSRNQDYMESFWEKLCAMEPEVPQTQAEESNS